MIQVSLDTSFLISFADPSRPNHAIALQYFQHCQNEMIPMHLSVVAAGEFEVGQPVTDLPLQLFRVVNYNMMHARRAGQFFKALSKSDSAEPGIRRVIINDLKIIAQAAEEEVTVILTEDSNTLQKLCHRLQGEGISTVGALTLKEGFFPMRLGGPNDLFHA